MMMERVVKYAESSQRRWRGERWERRDHMQIAYSGGS